MAHLSDAAATQQVVREIERDPAMVTEPQRDAPVGRLDGARAARQPDPRWRKRPAVRERVAAG